MCTTSSVQYQEPEEGLGFSIRRTRPYLYYLYLQYLEFIFPFLNLNCPIVEDRDIFRHMTPSVRSKLRDERTVQIILRPEEALGCKLLQAIQSLRPKFHEALVVIWLVQIVLHHMQE
jgi:hypothetical protein